MYINSLNRKVNHESCFIFCLFKRRQMNKTDVKIHLKFSINLLGGETAIMSISCSPCLFHIQHAISSFLEGYIRKDKTLTSGN